MLNMLWNRRFWVGLATVVALLATMTATPIPTGALTHLQGGLSAALWPAEAAATAGVRAVQGALSSVTDLWTVRRQNAVLRSQVRSLEARVAQDGELKQEYGQLLALLKLKSSLLSDGSGIAAQVIGRNADSWFEQIVLSKGSADGVRPGMVVMAPQGVVGHVVSTGPHSATAMLITNPDSGVGAMIESTRDAGVVLGQLGRTTLTMEFFAPSPAVKRGDVVVTSGLGGLYPKGLQIGTVTRLNNQNFGLVTAEVTPSVNLNRLEDVLLIPGVPASS